MKRLMISAVILTAAAAAPQARQATEGAAGDALTKVAAAELTGTVMNVDIEKKSFTVVSGDRETVVSFTADTEFMLDGKVVDAARVLKIGSEVRVDHEDAVARKVEARTQD